MALSDDVKWCERIADEKQKVVNRIHRERGIDAETPLADVHAIRNVLAELARLQGVETRLDALEKRIIGVISEGGPVGILQRFMCALEGKP